MEEIYRKNMDDLLAKTAGQHLLSARALLLQISDKTRIEVGYNNTIAQLEEASWYVISSLIAPDVKFEGE